jgi:hypothetical protein
LRKVEKGGCPRFSTPKKLVARTRTGRRRSTERLNGVPGLIVCDASCS